MSEATQDTAGPMSDVLTADTREELCCVRPRKVIDQYDDAGDEFHFETCGRCIACQVRADLATAREELAKAEMAGIQFYGQHPRLLKAEARAERAEALLKAAAIAGAVMGSKDADEYASDLEAALERVTPLLHRARAIARRPIASRIRTLDNFIADVDAALASLGEATPEGENEVSGSHPDVRRLRVGAAHVTGRGNAHPKQRTWWLLGRNDAALVMCGPRERPYWWVICPANATLALSTSPLDRTPLFDGCSDPSCEWDEIHAEAGRVYAALREGPTAKGVNDA